MEESVKIARCPGTCGEWVQGARNGIPFLVDCPIDLYSIARVKLSLDKICWSFPPGKEKVSKILKLIRSEKKFSYGGEVQFLAELPIGKGMASSTADMTSAAAAALLAMEELPRPKELANLALKIEPSDSVMFPGITEIAHVDGTYHKVLGPVVPAQFLALDWGGQIDTLSFNARQDLKFHYQKYEKEISNALAAIKEGIERSDLEKMAYGSTMSALCNLEINPKPLFQKFHSFIIRNGGLGVITAHSGTLLAGVFPPGQHLESVIQSAKELFEPSYIDSFNAINGGVDWGDDICMEVTYAGPRKLTAGIRL